MHWHEKASVAETNKGRSEIDWRVESGEREAPDLKFPSTCHGASSSEHAGLNVSDCGECD